MSKGVSPRQINVSAIVERIKEAYGYKYNSDVARHLGLMAKSDPMSKHIERNSINLQRVVEACPDLNQDWLIWGRGDPHAPNNAKHEVAGYLRLKKITVEELVELYNKHREAREDEEQTSN